MKYILSVFAVLMVIVRSCYLIYDPYCCDGNQYVNDCFAKEAGQDLGRCVHCECYVTIYLSESKIICIVRVLSILHKSGNVYL